MDEATRQATAIRDWYLSDSATSVTQGIRDLLDETLPTCFGYHLCEMADYEFESFAQSSKINHCFQFSPRGLVVGAAEQLPFESESIDVIIALHCLDTAQYPHQVLREIQRVLTPQGQLFLVGFNPWSIQGLMRVVPSMTGQRIHPRISVSRLDDWFQLLGFERAGTHYLGHLSNGASYQPLHRFLTRCSQWLEDHCMPAGRLYWVRAIKQVSALHRPQLWKHKPRLRVIGLKESASAPRQTRGRGLERE